MKRSWRHGIVGGIAFTAAIALASTVASTSARADHTHVWDAALTGAIIGGLIGLAIDHEPGHVTTVGTSAVSGSLYFGHHVGHGQHSWVHQRPDTSSALVARPPGPSATLVRAFPAAPSWPPPPRLSPRMEAAARARPGLVAPETACSEPPPSSPRVRPQHSSGLSRPRTRCAAGGRVPGQGRPLADSSVTQPSGIAPVTNARHRTTWRLSRRFSARFSSMPASCSRNTSSCRYRFLRRARCCAGPRGSRLWRVPGLGTSSRPMAGTACGRHLGIAVGS